MNSTPATHVPVTIIPYPFLKIPYRPKATVQHCPNQPKRQTLVITIPIPAFNLEISINPQHLLQAAA